MPAPEPSLDLAGATAHVLATSFRSATRDRVGIELELIPMRFDGRRAGHEEVSAAIESLGPLASGTTLTFEPGGQVELSTPPATSVDESCATLSLELERVRRALGERGVVLAGVGLDPSGPPTPLVVGGPRYEAMATYFGALGSEGATMMCSTAGVQVNLEVAVIDRPPQLRWGLAHLLGPVLAASFANSPLVGRRLSGWRSSRLANWWRLDPPRTSPAAHPGSGPSAWAHYALAAPVMLVRQSSRRFVPVLDGMTFAAWIRHGHPLGYPTLEDLDYHLTTLFPPIRPRGWLELRMFDSLAEPWWRVPVAVATALLQDATAAETAAWAARNTADLWVEASQDGLADPRLAAAARACFQAALDGLGRMGVSRGLVDVVSDFADRYVERGRCPADDRLDAWAGGGRGLSELVAR